MHIGATESVEWKEGRRREHYSVEKNRYYLDQVIKISTNSESQVIWTAWTLDGYLNYIS